MSENNIPCIQLIGDKEDFSRWAEAEVLPYEGARRLNLGPVTTYFDGKGGIKHILALNPERVRILEDAIHEYYVHEKDQDGPDLLADGEDHLTDLILLVKDYREWKKRQALREAKDFGVPWDISRDEPENV